MLIRRAAAIFLPLAVLATLLTGLIYLTGQQIDRQGANDPQRQLAEDAAAALDAGETPGSLVGATPVEFGTSLAPFLIVFDTGGAQVATGGHLGGYDPAVPAGMLSSAVAGTPNVVTWEPQSGVRIAAVVVHWSGGTVLAGRSLREVERRIDQLTLLAAIGWLATIVALAVASLVAARLWPPASRPAAEPTAGSTGRSGTKSSSVR